MKAQEIQANINITNFNRKKTYELSNQAEKLLSEGFNPIHKIFFILRRSFSYQLKLIELAEEKNDEYILETLADLFSNRFYENILIQNPENEEFIILLFYLLKQEIDSMDNASLSSFLEEETKFIGKLLKFYISRSEFKSFLRMTFNEFIMKIQNQHPNIEIDTKTIYNYLKTKYNTLQQNNQNINNINSSVIGKTPVKDKESNNNVYSKNLATNLNDRIMISNNSSQTKITNVYDNNFIDSESLGKAIKRSSLLVYVKYFLKLEYYKFPKILKNKFILFLKFFIN